MRKKFRVSSCLLVALKFLLICEVLLRLERFQKFCGDRVTSGVGTRVSVLDCGRSLPLSSRQVGNTKRQRAAAVQHLAEFLTRLSRRGHNSI